MTSERSSSRAASVSQPSEWETAYLRFETPEQEIRKFQSRLKSLGAASWPKTAQIVELCCGRGSGLHALQSFGFTHIEGIDASPVFVERYDGPGRVLCADCRALPFGDESRDILIVQGGLHHLQELPGDLDRTMAEALRVLRRGGRFVLVEPWLTPFLRIVHLVCRIRLARAISPKVDALATMIEHERVTYDRWLDQPEIIRDLLGRSLKIEREAIAWGKLSLVARKP
jgi:SAM-dependent methyltransferase